jgi:hypothetical protein
MSLHLHKFCHKLEIAFENKHFLLGGDISLTFKPLIIMHTNAYFIMRILHYLFSNKPGIGTNSFHTLLLGTALNLKLTLSLKQSLTTAILVQKKQERMRTYRLKLR